MFFPPKFLGWKFENRKTTTFLKPRMSWNFHPEICFIEISIYNLESMLYVPVSLGPPCLWTILCHHDSPLKVGPKPIRSGLLLMRYFMISKDPSKVARCKGVTPWPGGCIGCIGIPGPPFPCLGWYIHPQIDEPVTHSHQICVLPLAFWFFSLPKSWPEFFKKSMISFPWIWCGFCHHLAVAELWWSSLLQQQLYQLCMLRLTSEPTEKRRGTPPQVFLPARWPGWLGKELIQNPQVGTVGRLAIKCFGFFWVENREVKKWSYDSRDLWLYIYIKLVWRNKWLTVHLK